MGRSVLLKIAIGGSLLGLFVVASWALVDTGIHKTADYEFCTSCHSHAPIGTSYRADLHGGNNASGWRATCSQCHIPHDNSLHYMWVKGLHGVIDPTMELLKDPYDINWHANRQRGEEYVYDSGCLSCHKFIQETSLASGKAFLPHRKYFSKTDDSLSCVGCHEHVGHANLGAHLQQHGWELSDE